MHFGINIYAQISLAYYLQRMAQSKGDLMEEKILPIHFLADGIMKCALTQDEPRESNDEDDEATYV